MRAPFCSNGHGRAPGQERRDALAAELRTSTAQVVSRHVTLGSDTAATDVSHGARLAGLQRGVGGGHTAISVQECTIAQARALVGRRASRQGSQPQGRPRRWSPTGTLRRRGLTSGIGRRAGSLARPWSDLDWSFWPGEHASAGACPTQTGAPRKNDWTRGLGKGHGHAAKRGGNDRASSWGCPEGQTPAAAAGESGYFAARPAQGIG